MSAPAEELRQAAFLLRNLIRRPELAAAVDLPYTEPLAELLTYVADQYDGTVATAREVYGDAQGLRMAETMFRTGLLGLRTLAVARAINGSQP